MHKNRKINEGRQNKNRKNKNMKQTFFLKSKNPKTIKKEWKQMKQYSKKNLKEKKITQMSKPNK